jgi:hypothetical protein
VVRGEAAQPPGRRAVVFVRVAGGCADGATHLSRNKLHPRVHERRGTGPNRPRQLLIDISCGLVCGGDGADWLLVFSSAKERECESNSCGHYRDGGDHSEGIVEKRVRHDPLPYR